ncbi:MULTISPECIES: GAF and ANTAR domain-containing protein [unclassified Modestobacter]
MAEERNFDQRLAAITRALLAEPDVEDMVQRVVEAAAATLKPEVYVSVSLTRRNREVETAAASDERAVRADRLQYELGEGPCLDAIWDHEVLQIDDLTTDEQYPRWSSKAAEETGIRSVLSLQLFTQDGSLGALNLFSPQVRAFDSEDRGEGQAFAAQAAPALRRALNEENLRTAMATRTLIGQAQGILMERLKVTPEQAFSILSRLSQDTNTKLREVARRLTETGEVPGR